MLFICIQISEPGIQTCVKMFSDSFTGCSMEVFCLVHMYIYQIGTNTECRACTPRKDVNIYYPGIKICAFLLRKTMFFVAKHKLKNKATTRSKQTNKNAQDMSHLDP